MDSKWETLFYKEEDMTRQDMTRPMCLELLTEPLYTFFSYSTCMHS